MPDNAIIFVHLSDIHFEAGSTGGPDDLDDDIRQRLLEDVKVQCARFGTATGILVCGDIAAKGAVLDYDYAREWLDKLCGNLGIGTECVWTIPGNHDIDQTEQRDNKTSAMQRQSLRSVGLAALDEDIASLHNDGTVRPQVYGALKNYNAFALAYGSNIDGENQRRWWDARFTLNDGSTLVVRGVNSTLASDKSDQKDPYMVVGTAALTMKKEPGVSYALMCHHPPHLLRDRATMDGALVGRASLQLFGHEHDQSVKQVDQSVRLFAGALHPARRSSGWKPQYYVIALHVEGRDSTRKLHVDVVSRAWSVQLADFAPDEAKPDGHFKFALDMEPWPGPNVLPEVQTLESRADPVAQGISTDSDGLDTPQAGPGNSEDLSMRPSSENASDRGYARRLAHRFFRLPIPSQWKIVRDLGYVDLQDVTASTSEFFAATFLRARNEARLADLWRMVENEHKSPPEGDNPFEGR